MRVHCRDETARNPPTLAFVIGQALEAIEMDQHGVPSRQILLLVRFIGPPVVPRKKPWPWMGPLSWRTSRLSLFRTTLSNVFVARGPGFRPFSLLTIVVRFSRSLCSTPLPTPVVAVAKTPVVCRYTNLRAHREKFQLPTRSLCRASVV